MFKEIHSTVMFVYPLHFLDLRFIFFMFYIKYRVEKKYPLEIMMVMYKNYMGCKTRYIRRVNVIKTINGNVYPLVLFREVFACGQKYKWVAFI